MQWQGRSATRSVAGKVVGELDQRTAGAHRMRKILNHVFESHFSMMWGEIALYSFIVLIFTGIFLTLFYDPSLIDVHYRGSYTLLQGVPMSRSYETSALNISFDVRGGLLVRQMHHWAADIFAAAIFVHMCRIFFTGAFRKPREFNWVIGVTLFLLAVVEGYMGYEMPDDLLSGAGIRIGSGVILSIPVIGTWANWLLFRGQYLGIAVFPERFYPLHILVVPALIAGLIAVHLAFVWFQEHTQFPGRSGPVRHKEKIAVGERLFPGFSLKSTSLALCTTGVIAFLGGVAQINPIFNYGPYTPATEQMGTQPDWYLGFLEGALRLWPPWEVYLGHYMIPAPFFPAVFFPLVFLAILISYPFLERVFTKDRRQHNLLQRPRDVPHRTAIGLAGISLYTVTFFAGADDIIAYRLFLPYQLVVWIGRIGVLLIPPLVYWITYHFCMRLQSSDRDVIARGLATGVVHRRPEGTFVEVRQPLADVTDAPPEEYDGARVPKTPNAQHLARRLAARDGDGEREP